LSAIGPSRKATRFPCCAEAWGAANATAAVSPAQKAIVRDPMFAFLPIDRVYRSEKRPLGATARSWR